MLCVELQRFQPRKFRTNRLPTAGSVGGQLLSTCAQINDGGGFAPLFAAAQTGGGICERLPGKLPAEAEQRPGGRRFLHDMASRLLRERFRLALISLQMATKKAVRGTASTMPIMPFKAVPQKNSEIITRAG